MSGRKLYFVVDGLSQIKTWLRSYSWIGVQRLVRLVFYIYSRKPITPNTRKGIEIRNLKKSDFVSAQCTATNGKDIIGISKIPMLSNTDS